MLLNKVNVLDKGFVSLIESNCTSVTLQSLQDNYFNTKINLKLLDLCSATFIIKCPLFVQLNLSQFGLNLISTPSPQVEAFIPTVADVSGDTLEDKQRLVDYIKNTTEALLLNSKGMTMDGADNLTAQMLSPISVYNEIIVHGNLKQWINFINQSKLPDAIENYRKEIETLLKVEWKNLDKIKTLSK